MPIITLTTDFGHKDYFVSALRAALLNEAPKATVIDISHEISPFNHSEAAYILKNAFVNFPAGSIHIIGVDSELTPENKHLVLAYRDHFFIGANNGIFSLILDGGHADKVVEVTIHDTLMSSFPVLDVFVKAAAHLARKGNMDVLGNKFAALKELVDLKPVINEAGDQMIGSVIYIDNFGNVVTNIKKSMFLDIQKARSFTILTQSVKFNAIYNSYAEAINFSIPKTRREEDGKKIAIWNAAGHLELAIYKSNPMKVGSASTLFGLDFRSPVTISFR